jgi:putative aldouronate transport system permease protein
MLAQRHIATVPERLFTVANYAALGLFALMTAYPFWYVIQVSFTDPLYDFRFSLLWPRGFYYANYAKVFSSSGIGQAYLISILRVVIGVPLMVLVTGGAAFALTQKQLVGRNIIILYFFLTIFFSGGLIPTFMVYRSVGLLDTFWVLVLPLMFSVWTMIVMKTSFQTLPYGLTEAALIDGAHYGYIFFRIVLPLSMPMVATLSLFTAVTHWNAWFDGAFFVQNWKLKPLQTFLRTYVLESAWHAKGVYTGANQEILDQLERLTPTSLIYSFIVVGTVPILLVYPFIQRYFIKGVMIGSIKE